jgi:hypothetical protein
VCRLRNQIFYTGTRKSIYRFKQLCSVHDQIEKNLNPYKFRLSYLPEINIYNLKKSNNIKGN